MEPYRSTSQCCPQCGDMPLREFQQRLICDQCAGMLIDEADLTTACSDLVSKDIKLSFDDAKPTTYACPKCERAMTSCDVSFTPLEVKADVHRCERHGVWFRGGLLAGTFALLGRKAHGIFRSRSYDTGGATGLDGLPAARHGATSGLRISEWRNRPRRRDKTLTPINAYRDQQLACPVCTTSELTFFGDRYACAQCSGTFVQNAAFEAMVIDISKEWFELPAVHGDAGPRGCPVCTNAMHVEELDSVPIDRCAAHGIWFDANELTVALERASGQFDQGWRAWLKRVFA
jgi:Zn-finger nucleic acid-binding protein